MVQEMSNKWMTSITDETPLDIYVGKHKYSKICLKLNPEQSKNLSKTDNF